MTDLLSSLIQQIDLNSLVSVGSYLFFFIFILYGQRIQIYIALNGIGRSLDRLKSMSDKATKEALEYVSGGEKGQVASRITEILDYVTIMPVNLDPNGIVRKMEQVVRTSDERVRGEVQALLKGADEVKVSVAQNLIEIASALNQIHKVVRHYYLTGKKMNSYLTLLQLQMSLPQILEQADALVKATDTFKLAQPIGDGAGPLVASKLMSDIPKQKIARDTVMATREYRGRTLYIVKAEGPMGYVGEPDEAIQRLVEEMHVPLDAIIMIDAALKLEGEKTGEIAEGVGAAIGGMGMEKSKIEDLASKHNIPVHAVLIKENEIETITAMTKEISLASETAIKVVDRVIDGHTEQGDKILLAGIGNTLGIAQ